MYEEKLKELGLEVPQMAAPVANYVPCVVENGWLYISGQVLGSLDRVERIVKISGFVNSAPDFTAQPKVVNGASDLLGQVFGETGVHARSAVGVASLPLGACCEVELIAKIKD